MSKYLDQAKRKQSQKTKPQRRGEREELALARSDIKGAGAMLIETLVAQISPQEVCDVLADCMTASYETKSGRTLPDLRTRMDACKLYLAYAVGTPVQRQEQVNYNLDMSDMDDHQLIDKLAKSPAMLSKVKAMIEQAEVQSEGISVM